MHSLLYDVESDETDFAEPEEQPTVSTGVIQSTAERALEYKNRTCARHDRGALT